MTLPGVSRATLERDIARALEAAGAPRPAVVGLILVTDREIAALNRSAMGKSGPTDVLSFPLLPPESFPPHEGRRSTEPAPSGPFVLPPGQRSHLGEIVVSVERAVSQATEGHGGQTGDMTWPPGEELRLLVTHGALHLCGWDHAEPEEEAAMRAVERGLLQTGRS